MSYSKGYKFLSKAFESTNKEERFLFAKKAIANFDKEKLKSKEVLLNMGNAYRVLHNVPKAIECFEESASKSTPFMNCTFGPYAAAFNNLGLMYYALGNDYKAIDYYNQALDLDPKHFDAVWNYANARLRTLSNSLNYDSLTHYNLFHQHSNLYRVFSLSQ